MASGSSRSSNNVQHALCIEGLPSHYTWQDVKDLARNRAEHGIRANIVQKPGPNGEKVIVCFVNVSRRNEAINLYEWLTSQRIEGRYLIVHLFDDTGSCFQSNCHLSDIPCSVCRSPRTAQNQPTMQPSSSRVPPTMRYTAAPVTTASYGPVPAPAMPPQYRLPPALAARPDGPQLHAAAMAFRAQQASGVILDTKAQEFLRVMERLSLQDTPQPSAPVPVYVSASSGAVINTSNGYARTEIRGVFVQGLDYKTRQRDVEALFAKAGEVTRCEIHVNSSGKSKGTATVQFATAAEARHAIQSLDQFKWKGRILRVRSDREAVVTEAPVASSSRNVPAPSESTSSEPTIVDGSNSRQARRDSKVSSTK